MVGDLLPCLMLEFKSADHALDIVRMNLRCGLRIDLFQKAVEILRSLLCGSLLQLLSVRHIIVIFGKINII